MIPHEEHNIGYNVVFKKKKKNLFLFLKASLSWIKPLDSTTYLEDK